MDDAFRQDTRGDVVEPSVPGVSWAAVLAGAVASLALTLVQLSFGAGMGLAVVSPWENSGASATIWNGTIFHRHGDDLFSHWRLSRGALKWVGVQTTEVHFRDTAHGFLAWAAASVLGAVLRASPAATAGLRSRSSPRQDM
jgi:hypothetical protein